MSEETVDGATRLKDGTALVTGGARRIGRAMALALGRRGVNVVVHCHSSLREAEALRDELRALGVGAWTVAADLARYEEAEGLLRLATELAGPIDFLVNNASVFPEGTLADLTPELLFENVNVNALAPFLIARAFAAQGREDGAIVNLLDTRIAGADPRHAAYHLSKRMLFTLTRMMAAEFAPRIRVNAVAPGTVLPPQGMEESCWTLLASTNPLNKLGSPEGVAEAVVFLLGNGFITGQVIFVDGGRHMRENAYGC